MLALADFRELLGSYGKNLTDEQIKRLYEMERQIADAIFDQWLLKRNKKVPADTGHNVPVRDNIINERVGV